MITMIAAHANNYAIGKGNTLTWKCPADMAFFKKTSLAFHDLLMGSTTASGIGSLPHRIIHRFSHTPKLESETGANTFTNVQDILDFNARKPLLVCGGEKVYSTLLPYASRLLITQLAIDVEGADTFFPHYTPIFEAKSIIEQGISNDIPYRVIEYYRKAV